MTSPLVASSAKPAVWEFTISHEERPDEDVRACGSIFYTDTAEEIHELAERSSLKVRESKVDKLAVERDGAFPVHTYLEVREPENSKALEEIIAGLRSSYGIDLARDSLIPNGNRYFFCIRKEREFTKAQIEDAPYLQIHATKFQIGTWLQPTDDQYSRGVYAVENNNKQGTKVQFGFLSPFPPIGVDHQLKEELERHSLVGLEFKPITVGAKTRRPKKPIWNLSSSIVLPRTQTRFINKHGHDKEPFDDWSDRWESAFFYDDGYDPPVLRFTQDHLDSLGAFDVALSAERTGNGPRISFPSVIVSQRFRGVLEELKILGVGYTPVAIN
tara:strand:+ start:3582 stop:4568 length:987 start_codon:yes stop_codon:yes gene_type:complete